MRALVMKRHTVLCNFVKLPCMQGFTRRERQSGPYRKQGQTKTNFLQPVTREFCASRDIDGFETRLMRHDEVKTVFSLIDAQNWYTSFKKFAKVAETFPNRIIVAVGKEKEIVATVSGIPYGEGGYCYGKLVVVEEVRKKGFGAHMVRKAADSIPENGSFSFFATPETVKFYSDLGFVQLHHSQDHEWYCLNVDMNRLLGLLPPGNVTVVPYTPDFLKSVQAFDTRARGHNAEEYVRITVEASDDCLVALNKDTNELLGYIVGAVVKDVLVCDGLYAESDEIATALFRELMTRHPDLVHKVKIEVPPSRRFLLQFSSTPDPQFLIRITRFTRGPVLIPSFDKLYCVTGCDYSI